MSTFTTDAPAPALSVPATTTVLLFVGINFIPAYILYKKKIFIKL